VGAALIGVAFHALIGFRSIRYTLRNTLFLFWSFVAGLQNKTSITIKKV
jgi:hypothetical protein